MSSPLVLSQLLHPLAQMAVGVIFRTFLRWRVPGPLNHLFIGSITCTLRKWLLISQLGPMGTAHPKKGRAVVLSMEVEEDIRARGHGPSHQREEKNHS